MAVVARHSGTLCKKVPVQSRSFCDMQMAESNLNTHPSFKPKWKQVVMSATILNIKPCLKFSLVPYLCSATQKRNS